MSSQYGEKDETCPVSTGTRTRRVQSVRGEGRDLSSQYRKGGVGGTSVRAPSGTSGARAPGAPWGSARRASSGLGSRTAAGVREPAGPPAPAPCVTSPVTWRVRLVRGWGGGGGGCAPPSPAPPSLDGVTGGRFPGAAALPGVRAAGPGIPPAVRPTCSAGCCVCCCCCCCCCCCWLRFPPSARDGQETPPAPPTAAAPREPPAPRRAAPPTSPPPAPRGGAARAARSWVNCCAIDWRGAGRELL